MPAIGRLEALFLVIVAVSGLLTAMFVTRNPSWNDASLPPIIWPLGVSLVFDIVTGAMRGGLPPLAMPVRLGGVLIGMVLVTVLGGRI